MTTGTIHTSHLQDVDAEINHDTLRKTSCHMTGVCRNLSEAHTCFKQMFLWNPAGQAPYIKYEFLVCIEKPLALYVYTCERQKNKVILETICLHYLFICILSTAQKVQVYNIINFESQQWNMCHSLNVHLLSDSLYPESKIFNLGRQNFYLALVSVLCHHISFNLNFIEHAFPDHHSMLFFCAPTAQMKLFGFTLLQ